MIKRIKGFTWNIAGGLVAVIIWGVVLSQLWDDIYYAVKALRTTKEVVK